MLWKTPPPAEANRIQWIGILISFWTWGSLFSVCTFQIAFGSRFSWLVTVSVACSPSAVFLPVPISDNPETSILFLSFQFFSCIIRSRWLSLSLLFHSYNVKAALTSSTSVYQENSHPKTEHNFMQAVFPPLWWKEVFHFERHSDGHALGQMPQSDYLFNHRSQKAICIPLHRLSPGFSYFQAEQAPFFVGVSFGEGLRGAVLCRGVTPSLQQIRFAVSIREDVPFPQYH